VASKIGPEGKKRVVDSLSGTHSNNYIEGSGKSVLKKDDWGEFRLQYPGRANQLLMGPWTSWEGGVHVTGKAEVVEEDDLSIYGRAGGKREEGTQKTGEKHGGGGVGGGGFPQGVD